MMTNSFDDKDVDIIPEDYFQEVMFDKVSSRTEITCDSVTIWSYDHDITATSPKIFYPYEYNFTTLSSLIIQRENPPTV